MRLKVIALGIILALSASGCQKGEQRPDVEKQESTIGEKEKEVILPEEDAKLTIMVDHAQYGEAIADGFKAYYPNVDITIRIGLTKDIDETVRVEGPLGDGPDVFIMAHDRMAGCVEYGMMLPMDESIVEEIDEQFLESALKTAQIDGITYGLPITTEAMALYYNKDIVGEKPADTFEEIFELAEELKGQDQYAFLMNISDAYNAYAMLSTYGFNLFGEDGQDVDQPGIDSEVFAEGLGFIKKLKTIMPLTIDVLNSDFIDQQFISGKAAYVFEGPWKMETYKNSGINLGVTVLPTMEGRTLSPFGGVINAHVSAYTKYPNAASLLVKYMASAEGAEILYKTRKNSSALKDTSTVSGLKDDELTKMFGKQFETAKPMPSNSRIDYYWDIVPDSIKAVFDEGKSPEEVKNWTSEAWNNRISNEYFGSSS